MLLGSPVWNAVDTLLSPHDWNGTDCFTHMAWEMFTTVFISCDVIGWTWVLSTCSSLTEVDTCLQSSLERYMSQASTECSAH